MQNSLYPCVPEYMYVCILSTDFRSCGNAKKISIAYSRICRDKIMIQMLIKYEIQCMYVFVLQATTKQSIYIYIYGTLLYIE